VTHAPDVADIPANLPTAAFTAEEEGEPEALTEELTDLETQAHLNKALVSTDALRHFVRNVDADLRSATLENVILKARTSYPSENGWVVINLVRMESSLGELLAERTAQKEENRTSSSSERSLSEAIIAGDVAEAYRLIAHRPMVALARATAELDALYRLRKGEEIAVETKLKNEAARLTDEQLRAVIDALTSALDGTYTDEASAVKTAILKAASVTHA
jgi:hypothetical protein